MSSFRETQHSCADRTRSDKLAFLREPLCISTYRAKNGSSYTHTRAHARTHSHTCVDPKQTRIPSLVQSLTLHVHAGNHLDSCRSMITCILLIQTQLRSVVDKQAHMQPHTQPHVHAPLQICPSVAAHTYQGTVFICARAPSWLRSRPLLLTPGEACRPAWSQYINPLYLLSPFLPVHLLRDSRSLPFPSLCL